MTGEGARDVVRRFYERANKGDLDGAVRLFALEAVAYTGGRRLNARGIREALANDRAALPDLQTSIEALVSEADVAVARISLRGTQTGTLKSVTGLEVAATGRPIVATGIVMFRVQVDGRIAEMWEELDRLSVFRQMGAVECSLSR